MADRLFSAEAEGCVIGGLMVSPVDIAEVAGTVSTGDFAVEFNRRAFSAMLDLAEKGSPIDLLTVAERLESDGGLRPEEFAGMAVLVRDTPSAANVIAYAALVRNYSRRRRLLAASAEIGNMASKAADVEQGIAGAKALLDSIDSDRPSDGPQELASLMPDVLNALDDRAHRKNGALLGLSLGLPDVDRQLDGLCPGRLYVVAGRPGMGKSVFALQAARAAIDAGERVVLFSAEMPSAEIIHRLIAAETSIPFDRIQSARLTDPEWSRLLEASTLLESKPLHLDDSSQIGIYELQARSRRLHRRSPLGLIVIDYVQLMDGEPGKRTERVKEIGSITRGLKRLAKELSIPVLAVSALNRALEQRGDKRPIMSDLRESGEIEQDADVVMFVYRDEVYNRESVDAGCAELIVGKNRGGPLGMVPLRFDGACCRFQSLQGGLPSRDAAPEAYPRRRGWGSRSE